MIAIINYGAGNLGSIQNMLKVIGAKSIITDDAQQIVKADKIILPGVGAFDTGMSKLHETGLVDVIKEEVADNKKPLLGICLGMQLLGRKSEEGTLPGLSLIPFDNVRFKFNDNSLKIPHMGWDIVERKKESPILNGIDGMQRYYFVHSYHAKCDTEDNVLMTCDYGYEFVAAVVRDNIYGVQFHPEKSHDFGMKIFRNFVERC